MKCIVCGCTDDDCSQCIRLTGAPCAWYSLNHCTACYEVAKTRAVYLTGDPRAIPRTNAWAYARGWRAAHAGLARVSPYRTGRTTSSGSKGFNRLWFDGFDAYVSGKKR